jgi:selenocysteine lyase/cysteine desulfurase
MNKRHLLAALLGVLVLAKAIQILQSIGMENVAMHERELTKFALRRLQEVPGIRIYGERDWTFHCDRVGVIPLVADELDHALLAAILSYEWGIGVRHGCFCAHTYVGQLFELDHESLNGFLKQIREGDRSNLPGFVRISLGIYNTIEEIEYLATALETITTGGPRGRYRLHRATGEYSPIGYTLNFTEYEPF